MDGRDEEEQEEAEELVPNQLSPFQLLNPPPCSTSLIHSFCFVLPGGTSRGLVPALGHLLVTEGREADSADSRPQSRMRRPKRIRH